MKSTNKSKSLDRFFDKPLKIEEVIPNHFRWEYYWIENNIDSDNEKIGDVDWNNKIWVTPTENKNFKSELIKAMNSAKEKILLSSFLLLDDDIKEAIINSTKKGVRAYILSAPEHTLDKDDDLEESGATLKQKTENFLKEISGSVLLRTAEFLHAKFLIIDPFTENEKGYVSTSNFNKALTENIEIGVKLNHSQIKAAYNFFVWGFWKLAKSENVEIKSSLSPIKPLPENLKLPLKINNFIYVTLPQHKSSQHGEKIEYVSINSRLKEILSLAFDKVFISSFGFDTDNPVIDFIKNNNTTEITVFTRPRVGQIDIINKIKSWGAKIFGDPKLHAKFIVGKTKDNKYVGFVTTANFQEKGLATGFEIGVDLTQKQAEFLFNQCLKWETKFKYSFENQPLKEIQREKRILVINNSNSRKEFKEITILPLEEIPKTIPMESYTDKIPRVSVDNIVLKKLSEGKFPLYFKVTYIINPPKLKSNKVKNEELSKKYSLEIYETLKDKKNKSTTFSIVVKNDEELNLAKKLVAQEKELRNAKIVSKK